MLMSRDFNFVMSWVFGPELSPDVALTRCLQCVSSALGAARTWRQERKEGGRWSAQYALGWYGKVGVKAGLTLKTGDMVSLLPGNQIFQIFALMFINLSIFDNDCSRKMFGTHFPLIGWFGFNYGAHCSLYAGLAVIWSTFLLGGRFGCD